MNVIGYGDNVVDRYVNKNIMYPGGNALNFAVYAKKSGAAAAYLGDFADDKEAVLIIDAMKDLGVSLKNCRRVFEATTERCDVNLVDGDRVFIGDDLRPSKVEPHLLTAKDMEYLSEFDLIHSGCYSGVESEMEKLGDLSALKTFDFSVEDDFKTDSYLQLICPHIDMALFSCEGMEQSEIKALQEKAAGFGTKYVLATLGVDGQIFFDGTNRYSGLAKVVEAVDTMGAGDSFFTSFVVELLRQGWKRGAELSQDMIEKAFETAAEFSASNCLNDGAFGYGGSL